MSSRVIAGSVVALVALLSGVARGQMGLTTASGTTSLLSSDRWTLSVDSKESSLSMTAGTGELGQGNVDRFLVWKATLAADKGQRSLFTKGEIVPGGTLEVRAGRTVNFLGLAGGFRALYASASYDVAQRRIVTLVAPDTFALMDKVGSTLAVGLGIQLAPTERVVLGLQGTATWFEDVPIARRPQSVSVIRHAGFDTKGNPITVSDVSDRYYGPTADNRGATARLDFTGPRWSVVGWEPAPDSAKTKLPPTVAILAAVSLAAREDQLPVYNFAAGPGFFAPNRATGLLGAVLFELSDFTNSTGDHPHLSDQFGVCFYLGLPWGPS